MGPLAILLAAAGVGGVALAVSHMGSSSSPSRGIGGTGIRLSKPNPFGGGTSDPFAATTPPGFVDGYYGSFSQDLLCFAGDDVHAGGWVPGKLPDGTVIVVGVPSSENPLYILDAKGRWWGPFMPPMFSGSGEDVSSYSSSLTVPVRNCFQQLDGPPDLSDSGGGGWFDKVNSFVLNKVVPAAAVIVGGLVGGVGGAAIALGIEAIVDMSNGASITSATTSALKTFIADNHGAIASQLFDNGTSALLSNASISALRDLRARLKSVSSEALQYFDQGAALGLAKVGQEQAIAMLKSRYADKAQMIDQAIQYGGQVFQIAAAIGGQDAMKLVDMTLATVRKNRGFQ